MPPELAYGNKGVQEIPPNATLQVNFATLERRRETHLNLNCYGTGTDYHIYVLQFDVELLSIKQDNFGYVLFILTELHYHFVLVVLRMSFRVCGPTFNYI